MFKRHLLAIAIVMIVSASSGARSRAADLFVYFGTQNKEPNTGFSLARFDTETGRLTKPELIQVADAPSYFVIHPDGKRLYSTNFKGEGGVSAYRIDPKTGGLTPINRISGNNAGTSFIGLDQTGRAALAANFASGHIAVFPLRPDGGLTDHTAFDVHTGSSINAQRQSKTYPHSVVVDPSNQFALVPDLGLDKIFMYRFDAEKFTLAANDPPFIDAKPGSGPRHVRFHSNGKWVYVIHEMGSMISAYDLDARSGRLMRKQEISTVPADFTGENNAAELGIHPNGRFLYGSNRGHDSLAVFSIDQATGTLTLVQHISTRGKTPRNFEIDPTGAWLLATNQDGNSAVVFRIDLASGKLAQIGAPVPINAPCCERFLPVDPSSSRPAP